jgi:hypothetical protein
MAPNFPVSVEDDHLNAWPLNAGEIIPMTMLEAREHAYPMVDAPIFLNELADFG